MFLGEAFSQAVSLVISFDPDLISAVKTSLGVAVCSTLLVALHPCRQAWSARI